MTAPNFFNFFESIGAAMLTALTVGFFKYWRDKMRSEGIREARSQRQSHAILLLAQTLDNVTERLHPLEKSNLAALIDKALRDENNSF